MAGHAYFANDILNQKLLVVGAGGIGCELLKDLAMAGFMDIEVVSIFYFNLLIEFSFFRLTWTQST